NELFRVWYVVVPIGEATLWHIHRYDNVIVGLADARLRVTNLGTTPFDYPTTFGEVKYAKATYTHRATNVGATDFHNFIVELLKPIGSASPKPNDGVGRTAVLDNDRGRV